MSKFGLEDLDNPETQSISLAARLSQIPRAQAKTIDLQAVDAAGAAHGFVSREPAPPLSAPSIGPELRPSGRRRRLGLGEPTRHLAIRLTVRQYERFVSYADRHQVTYQDALQKLLDESS